MGLSIPIHKVHLIYVVVPCSICSFYGSTRTPAECERAQHIIREVKKIQVPGVPKGLEI